MAEFSGWPLIGSKFARFGGPDVPHRLRRALNQWPDSHLLQLSRTLWIDANQEVVLIQKEDGTSVSFQVNTQIGSNLAKDTASITAGIGLTTPANGIIVTNTDTGTPTYTDVIVLGKNSHGYMDAKKSDGSIIFKADPITETYQLGLSSGTSTTTIYGETLVLSVLGSGTCLINGNGQITGVLESTVAMGTAPFTIASGTVNTNLNADLLDGNHASAFAASAHTHTESDITNLGTAAALIADNLSVFAATTSAQLAGVISDETGSGALVFGTGPTLADPNITGAANIAASANASETDGDHWTDSTQISDMAYVGGMRQPRTAALWTSGDVVTVANTTTQTSLLATGVGSKTVKSALQIAGKSLRIRLSGLLATAAAGVGDATVRFKWGASTISTVTWSPEVSLGTTWSLTLDVNFYGVGDFYSVPEFLYSDTADACRRPQVGVTQRSGTAADTAIDVTWQWSVADAANSVSCNAAIIEIAN